MAYPAHDVATLLAGAIALPSPPGGAAVVLTYADGGNLMLGPVTHSGDGASPQLAVFVLQTGGPPPAPYLGSAGDSWRQARVQVTVRSEADEFSRGEALARALWERAHLGAAAGAVVVLASESEPTYLGRDEHLFHRWSFNLTVGYVG